MKKCCVWQWRASNISWSTLVLFILCAHVMCSLMFHGYHFWDFFFFKIEMCFFNISSSLQDSSWETNSFTFCLRLFIIKSHRGEWWLGMKFLLLLSCAPVDTSRRAGRLLSALPLLTTQQTTGFLSRQTHRSCNLYHGTAPEICLEIPGLLGHRLAVP